MTRENVYCWNCGETLTKPTASGFEFEGDWYCSAFCAEACTGFWSRGFDVRDFNYHLGTAAE